MSVLHPIVHAARTSVSDLARRWLGVLLLLAVLAACSRSVATPTPAPTSTPPPGPVPTVTPPAAGLEDKASAFVDLLVRNEFEQAVTYFDPTVASQLPAPALAQTWAALIGQVGQFQHVERMRTSEAQGFQIVVVTTMFEAAAIDIQLTFDAEERVAGLFFRPAAPNAVYSPPPYADPDAFREAEVIIGAEPWRLPATLTLPVGQGPFPAVVLVHGSGPNDRNETIGPNRPFQDLGWGLASRGVVVLRYDKRTFVYPNEVVAALESFTVRDEVIDDALAAVAFLRNHADVDEARVFVAGHSLGGTMGPAIAAADDGVAGLVIMAGATRRLEDIIVEQMEYLAALDGTITEAERAQLEEAGRQAAKVWSLDIAPGEVVLGGSRAYWESLADYRPAETAAVLDIPMLIIHGGRDYQVTDQELEGWQAALGEEPGVDIRRYELLNHLMIPGEGTPSPAEYEVHGSVYEEVVLDIAAWVKAR